MPRIVRRPDMYASRKRPMGEMNVTPFIDILLVLVIMLILAVPIAKHSTIVELAPPGPTGVANSDFNTVFIDDGDRLFWNGTPADRAQLRANIAAANAMPEDPTLRFQPAALASYDQSAKTIALIKDAGAKKFAFVGNEQHRIFAR